MSNNFFLAADTGLYDTGCSSVPGKVLAHEGYKAKLGMLVSRVEMY